MERIAVHLYEYHYSLWGVSDLADYAPDGVFARFR